MENAYNKTWKEILRKTAKGLMVRTDSRKVRPGEIFVAMPGVNVPGTDFIPDAVANGAAYVIADKQIDLGESKAVLVVRPDCTEALGELARAHFKTGEQVHKVIGITGTNGKTTTAYLLEHLLASTGMKVGLLGTVVYRWPGFSIDATHTTPDCWTLHELMSTMSRNGVNAVIMEVSSHALDQNRVAGLEFDAAIMTNLTQDHLDYHGDMDEYFRAKALLFDSVPLKDKVGVINFNDPYGMKLLDTHQPAIGYGLGQSLVPEGAESITGKILSHSVKGMTLEITHGTRSWTLNTGMIGEHNAMNMLAAQGVALSLGLKPEDMKGLEGFNGVPGRLERVPNDKGLDIFVDYAHTPDALVNVLRSMRELNPDRLITMFGCGGDRDRTKRPLMAEAAAWYSDLCVITSDNPRTEDPEAIIDDAMPGLTKCENHIRQSDRRQAIREAVRIMKPGDMLLLAGKGHEDYQQIGTEKFPFSDQKEAALAVTEIYG